MSNPGSTGKVESTGWLEVPKSPGGVVVPRPSGINVKGYFRLVANDGRGRLLPHIFDTGEMPNCMTETGQYALLARFASDEISQTGNVGITGLHQAVWHNEPGWLGLGKAVSEPATYWGRDATGLSSPITYNSYTPDAITSIVCGATGAGQTDTKKVIFAANIAAGVICGVNASEDISEIGLFSFSAAYDLLAGTWFTPISISGAQSFTAFYSVGISQTA